MATEPATAIVDESGRLVAADPPIARLQEEAGSRIGATLAVPQLWAIARLARKLGVTVSRPAFAGSRDKDLDLWVRAEPGESEVRLTIESWVERPAHPPRWAAAAANDLEGEEGSADWLELDPELRVRSMAPSLARRLGLQPEQVARMPLTRLVRLEPDAEGSMPLLSAVALRRSFADQRAVAMSGGEEPLLLAGDALVGPNGSFNGYRAVLRAEAAQPSAEPQVAAIDDLLRQPLDRIIDEAQQIAGRAEGPLRSDYAAYASDIAAAARHLLAVLQSMGDESVKGQDRVDLAAIAGEAIGLVQRQADERGVKLIREGEEQLPVRGQGRALTQILVNLIGNAVRFSPAGQEVRVTLTSGDLASVTVADLGPGVPLEDQERIFERFEQVEPRGEGAGLGLAISRRLARSMGGDISLVSTPGQGARFTLSLPLA